jgi:hypothetical protein
MTLQEIRQLRENGQLEQAYRECSNLLQQYPQDRYVRVMMAWCLKSLCEQAAQQYDACSFCNYFGQLPNLQLAELGEQSMVNKFAWDVLTLFKGYRQTPNDLPPIANQVFTILKQLPFLKPHKNYAWLVDAFVQVKDTATGVWLQFVDFMDWWGFDNFQSEDYQRVQLRTQGHSIPSVAERAYTTYYKALAALIARSSISTQKVDEFIAKLDQLNELHPEFTYTLYHKTLLLIALGRRETALEALRPFVQKKQKDFWVWDALAGTTEDKQVKLSCYCKALTCRVEPKYLGKVRYKLSLELIATKNFSAAKYEIEQVIRVYNQEQWHVPPYIVDLIRQDWYAKTTAASSNLDYYNDHLEGAEGFLFLDRPEVAIMITRYNHEKQVCNFVTSKHQQGFFSTKKLREKFKDYDIVKVRFAAPMTDGTPSSFLTYKRVTDISDYKQIFWKEMNGSIHIHPGNSFGFVDGIYVGSRLMPAHIQNGEQVQGVAYLSYDGKKQTWGWRAVKINS